MEGKQMLQGMAQIQMEDWVVNPNLRRGNTRSSWSEPDACDFEVRDANYLANKTKKGSEPPLFSIVGVNALYATTTTDHVASKCPSLASYLQKHRIQGREFFIVNWMLPSNKCTVYLFVRNQAVQDPRAQSLYQQFTTPGDANDNFRKTRLKFQARVKSAPWVIKNTAQMLGAERPAILGGNLRQHYFYGENYMEVDIDVTSSIIAKKISGHLLSQVASVMIDQVRFAQYVGRCCFSHHTFLSRLLSPPPVVARRSSSKDKLLPSCRSVYSAVCACRTFPSRKCCTP
jgi:hypothetical protein